MLLKLIGMMLLIGFGLKNLFNIIYMIQILRKEGWILNPNDKVVNAILKRCELNGGHCPCHNTDAGTDFDICPCRRYREEDVCCCSLYIRNES